MPCQLEGAHSIAARAVHSDYTVLYCTPCVHALTHKRTSPTPPLALQLLGPASPSSLPTHMSQNMCVIPSEHTAAQLHAELPCSAPTHSLHPLCAFVCCIHVVPPPYPTLTHRHCSPPHPPHTFYSRHRYLGSGSPSPLQTHFPHTNMASLPHTHSPAGAAHLLQQAQVLGLRLALLAADPVL